LAIYGKISGLIEFRVMW